METSGVNKGTGDLFTLAERWQCLLEQLSRGVNKSPVRLFTPEKKEDIMRNVELTIEGMHCMKCVAKTKAALEAVPGVRNVEVSLEEGKATLEAGMVANNAKLIAAVEGAGFKAAVADPANHAGGGAF